MRFFLSQEDLDESFAKARRMTQPLIQAVYLGTATWAATKAALRAVAMGELGEGAERRRRKR